MACALAAQRPQPAHILVTGCGTGSELSAIAAALPQAGFTVEGTFFRAFGYVGIAARRA